ncbi:hypothetical protein AB0L71_10295 [Streptomyces sp. NPDC052052]|uniref:hypothetical protein n=1 Tax=Streptomyces sp. NPDC052052 TaxID=3154756 RepID=UPI0034179FFB
MTHVQVTARTRKRGKTALSAGLLTLLASTLVVSASSVAQADGDHCGHRVLGRIEQRYLSVGGPGGSRGCPLKEELVNPDGIG